MAETAWKAPQTAATVDRDGKVIWQNPDLAKSGDFDYSHCAVAKADYSDWLRLTNFGFTTSDIPSGSTIDGIKVQYRKEAGWADVISDSAIYLRKTSGQVGDNKASATKWATSKETITHGGSTDTWNSGLTDSDIRDSGFGIDLSAANSAGDSSYAARIYWCQIKIYYTEAGGETIELAGSSAGVASVSGAIIRTLALAGLSEGVATVSGFIRRNVPLSGVSVGIASVSGNLSRIFSLSGVSIGVATVSGVLRRYINISAASAGLSTVSGTIKRMVGLAGSSAGVTIVSGNLSRLVSLVGSSAGVAIVSGLLGKVIDLVGSSAGVATVIGALQTFISQVGYIYQIAVVSPSRVIGTAIAVKQAAVSIASRQISISVDEHSISVVIAGRQIKVRRVWI